MWRNITECHFGAVKSTVFLSFLLELYELVSFTPSSLLKGLFEEAAPCRTPSDTLQCYFLKQTEGSMRADQLAPAAGRGRGVSAAVCETSTGYETTVSHWTPVLHFCLLDILSKEICHLPTSLPVNSATVWRIVSAWQETSQPRLPVMGLHWRRRPKCSLNIAKVAPGFLWIWIDQEKNKNRSMNINFTLSESWIKTWQENKNFP